MTNEATLNQIAAADPAHSTWLTANAGSGKTKVLTDRVTRLLLAGADPECILCLTYTKAAAAEMQNRLFDRLGEWAMKSDPDLRKALAETGVTGTPDLSRARTLFARAIETPGGIKIQTIHAFCAMLLRRFPLEAGVSPGFRELDDAQAAELRAEVVDVMAAAGAPEIDGVAAYLSTDDITDFSLAVVNASEHFSSDLDRQALADCMGIQPDLTRERLLQDLLGNDGSATIAGLKVALASGSSNDLKALQKLAALGAEAITPVDHAVLEGLFLFGEDAKAGPYSAKVGKFPTKATRDLMGPEVEALDAMMDRAERLREPRLALAALEKADALRRFAQAFLPAYEAAKARRGALDFSDLIARAGRLLSEPSVADWVLYKIDGRLDHILVDEAQDTAPRQWDVIERLTTEMTAGQGARSEVLRALFVVGDVKQSIYSFQGADPRVMAEKLAGFRDRLKGGTGLAVRKLEHSFRSSDAILRVVDATFSGPRAAGLGNEVSHIAFHQTRPGRVDLWPLETPSEKDEPPEWHDPVDRVLATDPVARLATRIAAEITRWLKEETVPAKKGGVRRVTASDILILVQGRSALFHHIIRACKTAGLPVAGADRLRIQSELAVRDIVATLSFLALPEDDLALAAALRSPLFGWSERELFAIAQPRKGYLWEAVRESGRESVSILRDLLDRADFLRPHDLIEHLLTRQGGRSRLLARLGPEAEEGIDALLSEALRYEQAEPPSLQGFLTWHESRTTEIKRQVAGSDAGIRVMTVHGAKGLESPIVILPDTLRDNRERQETVLVHPDGIPLWSAARAERPAALAEAAALRAEAEEEERRRLLYVAMTRAESWLVVAGAGKAPSNGDTWYEAVADGLEAAGARPARLPDGTEIRRRSGGDWNGPLVTPEREPSIAFDYPPWTDGPDRPTPPRASVLNPSKLPGEKALSGEAPVAPADPLGWGTDLHLLLEHLPNVPPGDREAATLALLPQRDPGLRADLLAEAARCLDAPDLAHLFSPDTLAEAPFSVTLGDRRIEGTIDRLIVSEDRVLAVDFKSNRAVPDRPEDTPAGLLAQLGAYSAVLERIYPDRTIDTAILWTHTAELMPIPHDIVRAAFEETAIS